MTLPTNAPEWILSQYPDNSEERLFPFLASMLHSNFHQDYAMESENFEDIVREFRDTSDDILRKGTIADIERFLKHLGASDSAVKEAFTRIFPSAPQIEGWNGLSSRQWLLRVVEILD